MAEKAVTEPIRLIQVGMGGWGRNWARTLAEHPDLVEIVAHVDVVPQMLETFQKESGAPGDKMFATLDEALSATRDAGTVADGVLVTTALDGHIPVTLQALDAGMNVLVEKPFAPSLEAGQVAVDRANAVGKVLMVSQNYRFYPAPQAVEALVKSGELGPVGSVTLQFRKYAVSDRPATNNHLHIRHPLLMDMSIHHWDLMRYVLGQEPIELYCRAWNPAWSQFDDPAEGVGTIAFDGGAVVDYHGSWVSTDKQTTWGGSWRIECEQGVIEWRSRDDNSANSDEVIVRRRGKRAQRVPLAPMPWFDRVGSTAEFARAIRSGVEPITSGRDNLGSLALMFAMVESAESGKPVTLQGAQRQK